MTQGHKIHVLCVNERYLGQGAMRTREELLRMATHCQQTFIHRTGTKMSNYSPVSPFTEN